MLRRTVRFGERGGVPIDANSQCAAGDHGTPCAGGCGCLQELPAPRDVHSTHLLEKLTATAHAHLERQVQQRVDAGACRPYGGHVSEVAKTAFDVESLEHIEPGVRQLEDAGPNAMPVQLLHDVIAE